MNVHVPTPRKGAKQRPVVAHVAGARASCVVTRSCRTHLRRETASQEIEIRQGERREEAHGVLGQAAIADLGEAPEPFHHMEGMLPTGARLGAPAILDPLAGRQRPLPCTSAVDAVVDAVRLGTLLVKRTPVRLVAMEYPLWWRRSEIRPVRRSESDPPEGRSFYALCSLRALSGPWPGGVIGRSSGRAQPLATDARG